MSQATGQNLPPPQAPFVNPDGTLSDTGYQYLLSILQAATSLATASVAQNLVATGVNQATALLLAADWNEIAVAAVGSGVLLASRQAGQNQVVFNRAANAVNVYPPPGGNIDAAGVNIPFVLASGANKTFKFLSGSDISS